MLAARRATTSRVKEDFAMAIRDEGAVCEERNESVSLDSPFRLGLRERKRRRLRREIVEISLDLFDSKGYENTRVVDIVEELDISQPTFFRYFPSKAAVLYEAASMALEEPLKRVPLLRAKSPSVADYLKGLVRIYADVINEQAKLTRMIACHGGTETLKSFICPNALDTAGKVEHQDGKFYEQMQLPLLTQALEEGQRSGEFDPTIPVEQLRAMLWSILFAIVVDWASMIEPPYDLQERLAGAVDLFVNGCKGPRAAAA
jgi:AcrR family transcriptional regulator